MSRIKIFAALLVLGLGVAYLGGAYMVYVRGKVSVEDLGGEWALEHRLTPMSHSGPSTLLVRRVAGHRYVVDELVQVARLVAPDCVLYTTSRGNLGDRPFGVCGSRSPVLLSAAAFAEWRIGAEGAQRLQRFDSGKGIVETISAHEVIRLAEQQPVVSRR